MYTVTALYCDAEVSTGEGESLAWARGECIESIPEMYLAVAEDITLSITREGSFTVTMPLSAFLETC